MDGDTDNLQMEEMLSEALKQPTDRDEPSTKVDHEQQEFIDDYNSSGNDTVINDHEMKQSITVITAKDNNHSKQNKSMDINDSVELKIAEHQEHPYNLNLKYMTMKVIMTMNIVQWTNADKVKKLNYKQCQLRIHQNHRNTQKRK